MKKIYLLYLALFVLASSCVSAVVEASDNSANPNDDDSSYHKLELGDKVSISFTPHGQDDCTYDYTGLLLSDSDVGVDLEIYYFIDNTSTEYLNRIEIASLLGIWRFYGADDWHIFSQNNVTSSYFKQRMPVEIFDVAEALRRVSIKLDSYDTTTQIHTNYIFKGINNGNGSVELVGKERRDYFEALIDSEGDTNLLAPYN